jgi:hypothetical protein
VNFTFRRGVLSDYLVDISNRFDLSKFTRPLSDWTLGLIPSALSRILSTLGFGTPDTWRQAVVALRDYWKSVSNDRRAPSTLDDDVRLERRTSRQRRFRGQVATTLQAVVLRLEFEFTLSLSLLSQCGLNSSLYTLTTTNEIVADHMHAQCTGVLVNGNISKILKIKNRKF